MTVKTHTAFGLEEFRRGYQTWDVEALVALYAEDVEIIQIDRDHPPSDPRVRSGKDVMRGMFEHCAHAGVKATVENGVAGEDRAAATVTCEFPNGRKVVANAILGLRDGLIVREYDIVCGDQK
jgi:ketosteroid isomerase-like protein